VLVYQTQLENLCDQAMREKDQKKLAKLMDQILQLLAENQKDAGDVSTPHSVVPIYED
jgi:GTP cyclohydrolase I